MKDRAMTYTLPTLPVMHHRASQRSILTVLLAVMAALCMACLTVSPLAAQELETVDPDEAYAAGSQDWRKDTSAAPDGPVRVPVRVPQPLPDLPQAEGQSSSAPNTSEPVSAPGDDLARSDDLAIEDMAPAPAAAAEGDALAWVDPASGATVGDGEPAEAVAANDATYAEDDLIGAAEGVFGKGAEGLARMIEDLLKKEGQPNAYIVGREAGGAFIFGARYGSGTLHHKIEGERKVYWTGPSLGLDAGANAANTFVLVYNLWDSEDIFKRYPAGEGQAYFVGGLHASYVRRGDVVLIPIRLGAGVRLGVNAGYMKFSKKQRWLPF